MDIPYFKLHDIVCTRVTFIPDIYVEFHITSTLISSGLISSELISSGLSLHIQHVQQYTYKSIQRK